MKHTLDTKPITHELVPARVASFDGMHKIKALVLDSVTSPHSKAAYGAALDGFERWYAANAAGEAFSKAVVQRWVAHLQTESASTKPLSASTINLRLSAVRKLASEAADNGLMDAALAQGIARCRGVKRAGVRTGNWLTKEKTEELLNAPDTSKLKGVRDRAVLAVLIGCGLRRSEVSALSFSHIQQRDGRWVIVDLCGKGGRIRTVPMPGWCKVCIDEWALVAGISDGRVFRAMNNKRELTGGPLLPQNIMDAVIRYGAEIGVPALAPHDLRRTFAKLAHKGHAALEQIQLSLGHASIQTTERYLGVRQDLTDAPCDHLGISLKSEKV
jgi:site-specific recombinase XerD